MKPKAWREATPLCIAFKDAVCHLAETFLGDPVSMDARYCDVTNPCSGVPINSPGSLATQLGSSLPNVVATDAWLEAACVLHPSSGKMDTISVFDSTLGEANLSHCTPDKVSCVRTSIFVGIVGTSIICRCCCDFCLFDCFDGWT